MNQRVDKYFLPVISFGRTKMDFSFVQEFIYEYFTAPLARPGEVAPYNWVNTLAFALLALGASYLIFKGLKKAGVKLDEKFAFSIVPFIFFGSAVRVAVDAGTLPRTVEFAGTVLYPFVTPMVYALTFVATIACIAIGHFAFRGKFHSFLRASGTLLFLLAFATFVPLFKNYSYFALIAVLALAGVVASELISKVVAKFYGRVARGALERLTVFGHAFDGAATFVGVSLLGYSEQHVVANILFGIGSPLLFLAVKVLFASGAVEVISRELPGGQDGEKKSYLLLLLTIFGLAPGLRDALRILAGV